MKKYLLVFIVALLSLVCNALLADGVNSTSIFGGMNNSNIENTRNFVFFALFFCFIAGIGYWLYSIKKKNRGKNIDRGYSYSLFDLLIVIAIIGFLVAQSQTNIKNSRWQSSRKACYSNIRLIQGAVEIYNMDAPSDKLMKDFDINKLKGYIKYPEEMKCPEYENVSYTNIGDLSEDGVISCGDEPVGATISNQNIKKCHGTISYWIPTSK